MKATTQQTEKTPMLIAHVPNSDLHIPFAYSSCGKKRTFNIYNLPNDLQIKLYGELGWVYLTQQELELIDSVTIEVQYLNIQLQPQG